MRRVFIFAIGGTGARVLRSFTMLLASGVKGMDSDLEVVPIIIDYDIVNGDKTIATQCLDKYEKIRKMMMKKSNDDAFFMTKVSRLKDVSTSNGSLGNRIESEDFDVYFGPVTTDETFAKGIEYNLMTGDMNITHSLLESLYNDVSEKDKDAELYLNLKVGFKGNPNIGSVVFDKLKRTEEFKHFQNVFDPQTDRVFIISSIFGGTGSSGFPQVVNAIRGGNMPALTNAKIGALVVLPYFKVQPGDGAIDSNCFNSKTKAALSFYETSGLNNLLDAVYYIGDSETTQLQNHDGGDHQKNEAHIVELIGAMAIIDFCLKKNTDRSAYEFGVKKNDTSLNLSNMYEDECLHPYLDYLTRFVYMAKYYNDVLLGKRNKIASKEAYYAGLKLDEKVGKQSMKDFEEFIEFLKQWLEELGKNAHKFIPYSLDPSHKMTRLLMHKQLKERSLFSDDLTDSEITKMMNDAFSPEKSKLKSDTHEEIFFRIMRKTSGQLLDKINKL